MDLHGFYKKLQSWTGDCTQIHKIKWNIFCYGMLYKICLLDGCLGTRHRIQAFQGFSWSLKLFGNLCGNSYIHWLSSDNNLVLLHLWWEDTALNREKVHKCFVSDCRVRPQPSKVLISSRFWVLKFALNGCLVVWPSNPCLQGIQQFSGLKFDIYDQWFKIFPIMLLRQLDFGVLSD